MKKLVVDQKDLFFAFENRMPETNHYLDLETGEVIPVFSFNREKLLAEIKMHPEKYLKIDPLNAKKSFQIMKDYIETVPVPKVRKELEEALLKKGAFRSFRAVIDKYSEEKQLWLEFKRKATLKQIKDWLARQDIELELTANVKKYSRR
jgi:Uncharacterised protein family (UPF0158)